MKPKRPFSANQWLYGASNEFLVWHQIPTSAIIHTFAVSDLLERVNVDPRLGSVMQFEKLTMRGDFQAKILPALKAKSNTLGFATISALAVLLCFFGITHASPPAQISQLIADLVRGLGIIVHPSSSAEWHSKALLFDHALGVAPTAAAQTNVKLAFLEGLRWSFGDWIYGDRVKQAPLVRRRARTSGLEWPADVIAEGLDSGRRAVVAWKSCIEVGGRVGTPARPMLVADDAEVGDEEGDEDV